VGVVLETNRAAVVNIPRDEIMIVGILDVKAGTAPEESLIATVAGAITEGEGNKESTDGKSTHEQ
jgi:hypothetical protein